MKPMFAQVEPNMLTVPNVTTNYQIMQHAQPDVRVLPTQWGDTIGLIVALIWGIFVSWRKRTNETTAKKVVGVLKENIDEAKAVIDRVAPAEKEAYVATIKGQQEDAGVREEVRKAL